MKHMKPTITMESMDPMERTGDVTDVSGVTDIVADVTGVTDGVELTNFNGHNR